MFNFVRIVEGYSRGYIIITVILGVIIKPILDNGVARPLDFNGFVQDF